VAHRVPLNKSHRPKEGHRPMPNRLKTKRLSILRSATALMLTLHLLRSDALGWPEIFVPIEDMHQARTYRSIIGQAAAILVHNYLSGRQIPYLVGEKYEHAVREKALDAMKGDIGPSGFIVLEASSESIVPPEAAPHCPFPRRYQEEASRARNQRRQPSTPI
jgi:hypothetical protein